MAWMITWDDEKRDRVIEDHNVDLGKIDDVFADPYAVYLEDFEHSTESETRFNVRRSF